MVKTHTGTRVQLIFQRILPGGIFGGIFLMKIQQKPTKTAIYSPIQFTPPPLLTCAKEIINMPIATIKYDLSDPDDSLAFNRASKALDMALALHDLSNRLRETYKHDKPPITQEEFYAILSDHELNLSQLTR